MLRRALRFALRCAARARVPRYLRVRPRGFRRAGSPGRGTGCAACPPQPPGAAPGRHTTACAPTAPRVAPTSRAAAHTRATHRTAPAAAQMRTAAAHRTGHR
eukprot:2940962-Prymnesium_polylepis.1